MTIPIVFINCSPYPFIKWIIQGRKVYETRNKNTLKSLMGKTVYLAETGKGKRPVVKCSATIESVIVVQDLKTYNLYRKQTKVVKGSIFDFVPGKKKYLYKLTNIVPVPEFISPEGKRHGFTWMEYKTD